MLLEVKAQDEDGTIIFEGKINRRETGFLLQTAINYLVTCGVHFHLEDPDDADDPPLRMTFPTRDDLDD